jgi:hypothetical protein
MTDDEMVLTRVWLKVVYHPSGRYTLTERYEGQTVPRDTDIFGIEDAAEFYRAVARHIADRAARGEKITYIDW